MSYPALDATALAIVAEHLEADPGYLDRPECPYPQHVKELLKPAGATSQAATGELQIESEVEVLFKQLTEFGDGLEIENVAERMSWFRTRASLLDKIMTLKERASGIKQVSEFMSRVIQIMDDECTPDQRTRIMEQLRHV